MPSLMPGMPGTKEVFGISIVREDLILRFPPKGLAHYRIQDQDTVVMITGHRGQCGFGLVKKETALASVFAKYVSTIPQCGQVCWHDRKAYAETDIIDGVVRLNQDMIEAFHLEVGTRLLAIKSTTVSMGFAPVEVWEENFRRRGMTVALENMNKLEVY